MPRFDYRRMVEEAMRSVVRAALREAAEEGLDEEHHFLIKFRTDAPGVEIPPLLRDLYPKAMTIVIQHQYWNLETEDDSFAVTLSFSGARHRLRIPYQAIETFADPGASFLLPLEPRPSAPGPAEQTAGEPPQREPAAEPGKPRRLPAEPSRQPGEVVRLDEFRKK
jgi:hypothetical protein